MRTRHAGALAGLGVAASCLLSGCADPSLEADAEQLHDAVRALPGVASADAEYTAPVALDSGKLRLAVRLDRGATPDEVADVGSTIYEAFSTTHRGEEADADVTIGASRLHLRSFQPEADVEAVAREWRLGAELAAGNEVALDVMTQDVASGDHVRTQVDVTLGDGTGASDVTATLAALERAHGGDDAQRGWGVRAGDGSGVERDDGFPTEETLASWQSLRDAATDASDLSERADVGVDLSESDDPRLWYVTVAIQGRDGDLEVVSGSDRLAVLDAALAQLEVARTSGRSWVYDLQVDGAQAAFIDPDLCEPGATSDLAPLDQDLRTPENCPGPESSESS